MSTEKKTINYNGMELDCIESGYWPDGIDMLCTDSNVFESDVKGVVCLQSGVAFLKDGCTTSRWKYWAILPPCPPPRRLTNRETYGLWRKGYDFQSNCGTIMEPAHCVQIENCAVPDGWKLRAPNTDEWLEPTSDLL